MTSVLTLIDSLGPGTNRKGAPMRIGNRLDIYRVSPADPWDPAKRWPNVRHERATDTVIDLSGPAAHTNTQTCTAGNPVSKAATGPEPSFASVYEVLGLVGASS